MAAIERTAYPRFKNSRYRKIDLQLYLPSDDDLNFMRAHDIRSDKLRLSFMVQLKTFHRLGYFAKLGDIPSPIIRQIRQSLSSPSGLKPGYKDQDTKYSHRQLIRSYLNINADNKKRDKLIGAIAKDVAQSMNDPADIINRVIEEVKQQHYELPAFSAIDKRVCDTRRLINNKIFKTIADHLSRDNKLKLLSDVLTKDDHVHTSPFNRFKKLPKKPTVTNFKVLVEHHNWLMGFGDFNKYLKEISKIKLSQFSEEARAMDAGTLKRMHHTDKRFSLIACLIAQAQRRTKDALALMFCRNINNSEKDALRYYLSLDKR